MNEIANLCERVGANVDMVRLGMGADSRIGKRFLFPGIGYGGSCFPKDVKALHKIADQNDFNFRILDAVIQVNINQRTILFDKLHNFYKGNLNGKTIAIWGLSFKPNTDDIREAPALYIIDKLLDAGAKIRVFDPEAMDNVRRIYGEKLFYAVDQYEVLNDCDTLMIMTEWNEFRSPQFDSMFHSIKDKAIFDGRNIFDPKDMQEKGFHYESIGRPV